MKQARQHQFAFALVCAALIAVIVVAAFATTADAEPTSLGRPVVRTPALASVPEAESPASVGVVAINESVEEPPIMAMLRGLTAAGGLSLQQLQRLALVPPADTGQVAPPPASTSVPSAPSSAVLRPRRAASITNTAGSAEPVEVTVYKSALPETPDVAASTVTETVIVDKPPYDPWTAVRKCESGGNYAINTGNGFYGAYQFTISTWNAVANMTGRPDLNGVRPDQASPEDQDLLAQSLAFDVAGGGLFHWPICGLLYGS